MFSYEFYKMMHLLMIFLLVGSIGATFMAGANSKHVKILTGVSSFLIFVGGMGLMARLGVSHTEGWPTWVYAKLAIWVAVSALAPILGKRIGKSFAVFYLLTALVGASAYIAINKPF